MYTCEERQAALDAAMTLYSGAAPPPSPETIVAAAVTFLAFLSGAVLRLAVDPFTYEQGDPARNQPTRFTPGGNVQLTDTQQVTATIDPKDTKGFDTSDSLTWSTADPTVVSLVPSADSLSCLCVAGVPGVGVVVTVTDGVLSASESFDVVAGAAASLAMTLGTPEDQPPAPPAPAP